MQKMHYVMPDRKWPRALKPRRACLAMAAVCCLSLAMPGQAETVKVVKIAAASNLKFVLADLTSQYKQQTGVQVDVNLGASGNLARQVMQGLPVEQFISADEAWVGQLVRSGRTLDEGQRYATGRLALVVPKHSALPWRQGLAAVANALKPGDKFAWANPALAPYGVAAEQVMQRLGLLGQLASHKVMGDNIGQTTQFVATGAAQAGITALSLATAPAMATSLQALPLPETGHAPLHQRMVLLKGASPAAVAWQQYLLSPQAQALFVRHGYALPQ